MTGKERLQQIVDDLTESEAQIVWDIHTSRPKSEAVEVAVGRGLAEVFRLRRSQLGTTGV
jgi:hypothetical protein